MEVSIESVLEALSYINSIDELSNSSSDNQILSNCALISADSSSFEQNTTDYIAVVTAFLQLQTKITQEDEGKLMNWILAAFQLIQHVDLAVLKKLDGKEGKKKKKASSDPSVCSNIRDFVEFASSILSRELDRNPPSDDVITTIFTTDLKMLEILDESSWPVLSKIARSCMECSRFQSEPIVEWIINSISQSDVIATSTALFINILSGDVAEAADNPVEGLLDGLLHTVSTSSILSCAKINTTAIKSIGTLVLTLSQSSSPISNQVLSFYVPKLLDADAPNLRTFIIHSIKNLIKCTTDEEQKKAWFQLIVDRCRDSSSFTRNAAIKTLIELTSFNIPTTFYPLIAQVAVDRLQDKTMIVKKSCLDLVSCLISHNPFMCDLDVKMFEEKMTSADNNDKQVEYCVSAVQFIKSIQSCIDLLSTHHLFSQAFDLTIGSLNCLSIGSKFNIQGCLQRFCQGLGVYDLTSDEGKKNEIEEVFCNYYIKKWTDCDENEDAAAISQRLLDGIQYYSSSGYFSILVNKCMSKQLKKAILTRLCQTSADEGDHCRKCLQLLSILDSSCHSTTQVIRLLNLAVDERDFKSLTYICQLLTKSSLDGVNEDERSTVISSLSWVLAVDSIDESWFACAVECVNALFVWSNKPEVLFNAILQHMMSSDDTSHLIHVCSHACLKMTMMMDIEISAIAQTPTQDKTTSRKVDDDDDDALEKELGMKQASNLEEEKSALNGFEREILVDGTISSIISIALETMDQALRSNRAVDADLSYLVLSLSKLCMASSAVCQIILPRLEEFLQRSQHHPSISNIAYASCDIILKYPLMSDKLIHFLFKCLDANSDTQKKLYLIILTRLLLSDIIKARGSDISHLALCLEDEDVGIQTIAKSFFVELSQRSNNPLLSQMPDIVSQISETRPESLRLVMDHLLPLIDKEKQTQVLFEKLCMRLVNSSENIQVARDLAHCMNLISDHLSTKGLDKALAICSGLKEVVSIDDQVYRTLMEIPSKLKNAKSSETAVGEENEGNPAEQEDACAKFIDMLNGFRNGSGGEESKTLLPAVATKKPKKTRIKKSKKKKVASDEDDDDN